MAQIDTSIYSNLLRPPKSVAEYDAEAMQGQQNKLALTLGQQKADEYSRGLQDSAQERQIVGGFGADREANYNALIKGGRLKSAQGYAKENADIGKLQSETESKKLETAHKRIEIIGQGLGYLKDNPSMENAQRVIQGFVQSGLMDATTAQEKMAAFQSDPTPQGIQKLALMGYQGALSAKDQLPKLQTLNVGNAQVSQSVNPITGRATETGRVGIEQSPDSIASNATSRANNAASVGASYANAGATRAVAASNVEAARLRRDQDTEMKLSDDYRAQSKDFKAVGDAYKQISATLEQSTKSPAATLAAATKFMKLLDPGSVVRESELGMALAATGVFDRATNYVNTLKYGKVLTPSQAADFKNITAQIYGAAQAGQQAIDKDYTSKANTYKLRPENIVQDLGQNTPGATNPATPALPAGWTVKVK